MTTPTVLGIELDIMWPRAKSTPEWEIHSFVSECSARLKAASTVIAQSGVPANVVMMMSPEIHGGDIAWFEKFTRRTHRNRAAWPDEWLLTLPGASEATGILIRQIEPGIRVLCPFSFASDNPATAAAELKRIDRDTVLKLAFDAAVTANGTQLDLDTLIAAAKISESIGRSALNPARPS